MGCDIHIVVERKTDNKWERIWEHDYRKPDAEGTPEVFRNRNYNLFGILADVRNGSGFAGCLTGEGWPSIAPGRGLPSDSTVQEDDDYTVGDHSFTWVALDELKAFPWDTTSTRLYGIVPADVFETLGLNVAPKEYSGGIMGAGIVVYEPKDYAAAKESGSLSAKPYVRTHWTETAREATWDWPGKVIPWLERLADGAPLRLVFGFDS